MGKQKIMYEITIKKHVFGEDYKNISKEGEKTVFLYEDEKIKNVYDWLTGQAVIKRKNGD